MGSVGAHSANFTRRLAGEPGLPLSALHRLEHRGWFKAEWAISELGRRARLYSLTASGRKQLEIEAAKWSKLSDAIGRVLRMA